MSEQTPEERAKQIVRTHYTEVDGIDIPMSAQQFAGTWWVPKWGCDTLDNLMDTVAGAIRQAENMAQDTERRRWYEWCDQARTTWDEKVYEAMDYEEHEDEDVRQSVQRQRQFWEGATHALHCAIITNAREILDAEIAKGVRRFAKAQALWQALEEQADDEQIEALIAQIEEDADVGIDTPAREAKSANE